MRVITLPHGHARRLRHEPNLKTDFKDIRPSRRVAGHRGIIRFVLWADPVRVKHHGAPCSTSDEPAAGDQPRLARSAPPGYCAATLDLRGTYGTAAKPRLRPLRQRSVNSDRKTRSVHVQLEPGPDQVGSCVRHFR